MWKTDVNPNMIVAISIISIIIVLSIFEFEKIDIYFRILIKLENIYFRILHALFIFEFENNNDVDFRKE